MKHQQVSVDYWAMGKAILTYGGLTVLGWIMMRLFNTVFTLPRRMRDQQDNMRNTLAELQRRFPDIKITEEDLKNAEQELEAIIKEEDDKKETAKSGPIGEKVKPTIEITEDTEQVEAEATGGKEKDAPVEIEDKKSI